MPRRQRPEAIRKWRAVAQLVDDVGEELLHHLPVPKTDSEMQQAIMAAVGDAASAANLCKPLRESEMVYSLLFQAGIQLISAAASARMSHASKRRRDALTEGVETFVTPQPKDTEISSLAKQRRMEYPSRHYVGGPG
jgi:hypothetical protein